jgi:predicted RNA-binding protein with PIN domain
LIDGYNVIFKDSALRKAYQVNNDAGRARLLEMVNRYANAKSLKCAVVFDGGETDEGRVDHSSPGRVDVIFVKDADQYIRRKITSFNKKEELTVISSDEGHIGQYSRMEGVRVIGVKEFMRLLMDVDRRDPEDNGEKPREETKAGVDYWIKRMGADKNK